MAPILLRKLVTTLLFVAVVARTAVGVDPVQALFGSGERSYDISQDWTKDVMSRGKGGCHFAKKGASCVSRRSCSTRLRNAYGGHHELWQNGASRSCPYDYVNVVNISSLPGSCYWSHSSHLARWQRRGKRAHRRSLPPSSLLPSPPLPPPPAGTFRPPPSCPPPRAPVNRTLASQLGWRWAPILYQHPLDTSFLTDPAR